MSDDADERAAQRVGSVLNDKWTLERLIGIGGMAAVYAGLHRNGARAAIKVLHPALARRSELKERFLREGYAANRVNHSGVVKVLDDDEIVGGPDDGGAFLVMELLEGQSLEDRLERGPKVEERDLLPIVRAVLDVLEVAHNAGVIHRDLKPENLFLACDPAQPDAPPRIKILDFGLARVAEAGNKTMAGLAIGTPSYMPPEQAAGRVHDIDARSDLFALGASCFRILAGRTVHPADSAIAICALMAKDPAPKLRSVAPDVSPATAAVVDRALAFRREDRWPDAGAMRGAIDDAISEIGGDVIQIESGMIEVVAPPRKRGWLLFWVALLLALVCAVAVKVGIDHFGLLSLLAVDAASSEAPTPPIASIVAPLAPTTTREGEAAPDTPDAAQFMRDREMVRAPFDGAVEAEAMDADVDDALPSTPQSGAASPPMSAQPPRHPARHDGGTHHTHGPHHHK